VTSSEEQVATTANLSDGGSPGNARGVPQRPSGRGILQAARGRYHALPPNQRPGDPRDILTPEEAQALARAGAYPHPGTAWVSEPPARRRRLRSLVRRVVREELTSAIPSLVAAISEAVRNG
jgi:hypothetical protein